MPFLYVGINISLQGSTVHANLLLAPRKVLLSCHLGLELWDFGLEAFKLISSIMNCGLKLHSNSSGFHNKTYAS